MSEERSEQISVKGKKRKREEDDEISEGQTTVKKTKKDLVKKKLPLRKGSQASDRKSTSKKAKSKPRKISAASSTRAKAKASTSATAAVAGEPLVNFFQTETAGNNDKRITQIAIKIIRGKYSSTLTEPTFHRSVNLHPSDHHFDFDDDDDEENADEDERTKSNAFVEVFQELMEWISNTMAEVMKCDSSTTYYPVLAAHKGYGFHFGVLLDEMKRCEIDTRVLVENKIHFADTFSTLTKAKKDGHQGISDMEKVTISYIQQQHVGAEYSENDPRQKVESLEELFTKFKLANLLECKPATKLVEEWQQNKKATELRQNFGITDAQSKKLIQSGLTYEELQALKKHIEVDTFKEEVLKKLGRGKPNEKLVEKLAKRLYPVYKYKALLKTIH